MPSHDRRAWCIVLLTAAVVAASVLFIIWPLQRIYLGGANDFLAFYAGGKLAFTDRLYDPGAVRDVQMEAHQATGPALRFIRLPYYAVLLSPLTLFPYLPAYAVWQALQFSAVIAAVWLWPRSRIRFAYLTAASLPLYWSFASGQDIGFMLLGLSATIRLMDRRQHVAAAIVFASVGLLKFHFLWLTPLVLIRNRRMLLAFCVAVAALVSVGFLIDPSWPVRYYESVLAGRAVISKVPYSLFRWLGWQGLPLALIAAVLLSRRLQPETALPTLVVLAVVVSPHAYIHDYSLLVPAAALVRLGARPSFLSRPTEKSPLATLAADSKRLAE